MADPATQFQAAGINTNTYTPVKGGDLGGSHLFGGSGQIWAGIGKTALDAAAQMQSTAQMIQASPLNPEVKAQQLAQKSAAEAGVRQQDWADALPQGRGHLITGRDAQGNAVLMPAAQIQGNVPLQMSFLDDVIPKKKTDGDPPANDSEELAKQKQAQADSEQGDFQQHPENYIQNPATGSYERRADAPPLTTTPTQPAKPTHPGAERPTPNQLSKQQTSAQPASMSSMFSTPGPVAPSPTDFQGPNASQVAQGVQQSLQRNQVASSDQGVPAGYQPPDTGGGNVWNPMQPAPGPNAPVQPPQGGSPAAATKADQVAMQQWQNQNAHPVMSSQDALGWMKNQTTLAQDATYLPMGGPGGSPAYAFHMKGGGQNIVPVSQMVQKGAGPLIAAQNTSQILSATDQQQQGGPGAQGQPPANIPQQPNISPPPPANLPPPAPTGPPQAASPVYNPLPLTPGPIAPPAPGDYNPAPYRQAVAQATSNSQNLAAEAGQQAGTRSTDGSTIPPTSLDRSSVPQGAVAPPPENLNVDDVKANVSKLTEDQLKNTPDDPKVGDPFVKRWAGFDWYQSREHPNLPLYTWLPGSSQWTQRRYQLGGDGWHEEQMKDSVMNEEMERNYSTGSGVVPNKVFSSAEIKGMSLDDKKYWLNMAKYYRNSKGDPNDDTTKMLDGGANALKQLEMMKDIVTVGDTKDYGSEALASNKWFHDASTLKENTDPTLQGAVSRGLGSAQLLWAGQNHPMAPDMETALKLLGGYLRAPGMQPINGLETPAQGGFDLSAYIPLGKLGAIPVSYHSTGTAASNDPLDLPVIRYITQAGTKEEKLARINQFEDAVRDFYQGHISKALLDQTRVDGSHLTNNLNIEHGNPLRVEANNPYRPNGPNGPLVNPYPTQPVGSREEQAAGLRASGALPASYGNRPVAQTPQDLQKIQASHPSGSRFLWRGNDGKVTEYQVP